MDNSPAHCPATTGSRSATEGNSAVDRPGRASAPVPWPAGIRHRVDGTVTGSACGRSAGAVPDYQERDGRAYWAMGGSAAGGGSSAGSRWVPCPHSAVSWGHQANRAGDCGDDGDDDDQDPNGGRSPRYRSRGKPAGQDYREAGTTGTTAGRRRCGVSAGGWLPPGVPCPARRPLHRGRTAGRP